MMTYVDCLTLSLSSNARFWMKERSGVVNQTPKNVDNHFLFGVWFAWLKITVVK